MKRMARRGSIVMIMLIFAVAFSLYAVKHDTRRLSENVRDLERLIERAKSDISILRAEKAYLTHPERLERVAKERLGFGPTMPGQYARIEEIPMRPN